jgi:chromosome segregation ATPase
MIGQAPFAGYSVVDFAPTSAELEVTFDGSLLEGAGESATRYYAICGERDVVLDAYAVVQVPSHARDEARAPQRPKDERPRPDARVSELSERVREQQDALDAASVHAEEIERELDGVRADLVKAHAELDDVRRREAEASASRQRLEQSAHELREQIETLRRVESVDGEYAALEASLAERGHELTELRAEVERRGTLVRDLVEELRATRAAGTGSSLPPSMPRERGAGDRALHAQLDAAVERAVAAEAERAQLSFRLDEIRGELAIAENRFKQELEGQDRLEAALRGTVRGLNARLAEVIELHQLTQARLALAEDDRNAAEARASRLARELEMARDHVELEMARQRVVDAARAEDGGEGQAEPSQASGDLEAFQKQARSEVEQAREALTLLEQRVEGMRLGYEARIAELRSEHSSLGYEAERALIQLGELRSRLDAKDRTETMLRGELAGVQLRLADREAAVEALRGARSAARDAEIAAELERARVELTSAREESGAREAALASELEQARAGLAGARDQGARASALAVELEALRAELAIVREDGGSRASALAAELEVARTEIEKAHAAGARASALSGELEEAKAALSRAREEAGAKEAALAEDVDRLRVELDGARRELEAAKRGADARAAELAAELDAARAELARTREGKERQAAPDLAVLVSARDAIAARLQRELADAAERRRGLERRIEECGTKLATTREELEAARAVSEVRSHEEKRELADLQTRLERAERERLVALEALEDARGILAGLVSDIGAPASPGAASAGDGAALRRLSERVVQLDREAADRELMLRSLMAQLQERDDRLRALERLDQSAPADDPRALQAKLFEMEERVARLSEELENERDARRRS